MQRRLARKCISWLLIVVMLITNMPLTTLAEVTELHQHEEMQDGHMESVEDSEEMGQEGSGDAEIEDGQEGSGDAEIGADQEGSGDAEIGADQEGSGDAEIGDDQEGSGDAEIGDDQEGSGDAETGDDQAGSGDTETGDDQEGSGDAETGDDQAGNGDAEIGDDQAGNGDAEIGADQEGSGDAEVGDNQEGSGETGIESDSQAEAILEDMVSILESYLGSAELAKDEVVAKVEAMTEEELQDAKTAIDAWYDSQAELSEEDQAIIAESDSLMVWFDDAVTEALEELADSEDYEARVEMLREQLNAILTLYNITADTTKEDMEADVATMKTEKIAEAKAKVTEWYDAVALLKSSDSAELLELAVQLDVFRDVLDSSTEDIKIVSFAELKDALYAILDMYGITVEMTDEEIEEKVAEMSSDKVDTAKTEIAEWFSSFENVELTEEESAEIASEVVLLEVFENELNEYEEQNHIERVQILIDAILMKYFGTTDVSEDVIRTVVVNMDVDTIESVMAEIETVERLVQNEEEVSNVELALSHYDTMMCFCDMLNLAMTPVFFATEDTVASGVLSVNCSSASSVSLSGNDVVIKAKGAFLSTRSHSIDIKNTTNETLDISFDISKNSVSALSAGTGTLTDSSWTGTLAANGILTLTMSVWGTTTTGTLTLSNFNVEESALKYSVTFNYDENLGLVSVDGLSVSSGETLDLGGASLGAIPASGAEFIAWVDGNNQILSTEKQYSPVFTADTEVRAVFSNSSTPAYFRIDGLFYENLNAATRASSNGKTIILMNSGILPAGNYTIPSGVTLLIPFDGQNTCYTTAPGLDGDPKDHPEKVVPYRTLTMEPNAILNIEGAMSISAKQYAAGGGELGAGAPTGNVGFVKMSPDSSIHVKSGGKLYAWGYIVGIGDVSKKETSGTVVAEAGATVYECFQVEDFRGGDQTTQMTGSEGVFPLSQYYVQNIEVPLTLEAGATEYSYTSFDISLIGAQGSSVAFISDDNAMFKLTSGSVTKWYDGESDRLMITADELDANSCDLSVSPVTMSIKLSLLGNMKLETVKYELPITNNITVRVNNGKITLNQDVAFLPGSEIIIGEDASCELGSGNSVYVYDADQWGGYTDNTNQPLMPLYYAPGRKAGVDRANEKLNDAKVVVYGEINASAGYVYSTGTVDNANCGAEVVGADGAVVNVVKGTQSVTYQLVQAGEPENSTYVEIPITPVKLKNADGTYVETSAEDGKYKYLNGIWHMPTCEAKYETTYVEGSEPTCTQGGKKQDKCGCGHELDIEEVDALGHDIVTVPGVEPTCLEPGLTDGSRCSRCEDVTILGTEIEALGHSLDMENGQVNNESTCQVMGDITYTCSRCKAYSETRELPLADHTEAEAVKEDVIAATCEKEGSYRSVVYCSVCNVKLSEETIITEKADHTEAEAVKEDEVPATCYLEGSYQSVVYCSVCDEKLSEETVTTEKADHTPAEAVIENRIDSTCSELGSYDLVVYCSVSECKEQISKTTVAIAKKDHSIVTDRAVAPTCTATGLTAGSHCENCDYVAVKQNVVPATGHEPAEAVIENKIDSTCSELGSYKSVVYCSTCEEKVSEETITIEKKNHTPGAAATCTTAQTCTVCGEELAEAKGHSEITLDAVESTCTATGLTEGKKCTVCGTVTLAQQIIGKKEHTPGAAATCTTAQTCTVCNEELAEAKGHSPETLAAVPATCTSTGLTEGSKCSACEVILKAQEIVAVIDHEAGETVKEKIVDSTCAIKGSYDSVVYCAVCNAELSRKTEVIELKEHTPGPEATCLTDQICTICNTVLKEALKHDYSSEVTREATCEEAGKEVFTCSRCGDSYEEEIEALGHDMWYQIGKDPTCTDSGTSTAGKCGRSGCEYTEAASVVPALGHLWNSGEVTKEATCEETGAKLYKCTRENCAGEKTEEIEKLPHTEEVVSGKSATCIDDGLTEGLRCSVCETWITEQEIIGAKGHTEVPRTGFAASCTVDGKTDGIWCSVCETWVKEQEVIPAPGHTGEIISGKPATCTEKGLTDGEQCSVCDAWITEQSEIPAEGHGWDEGTVTLDPSCTAVGEKTFTCSKCNNTRKESVDALQHVEGNEVIEDIVKATCEADGKYDTVIYCSRDNCGQELSRVTTIIKAQGHTEIDLDAVEPTCTTAGKTAGKYCTACESVTVKQETIKAKGHTEVDDPYVAPGCTTVGYTQGIHCSMCGEVILAQVEQAAKGHTPMELPAVEVGCLTDGLTAGSKCSVCDEILVEQEVITAKGHVEAVDVAVEATCTATGLTEGKHCSVCNEILVGQEVVPVKEHTEVIDAAVEATCTATGLTEGKHCSACNKVLVAQETVSIKEHTEVIDAAVEATCTATGLTEGKHCSVCNKVLVSQRVVARKNHTEATNAAVAPNCTEDGLTEGKYCSVCGEILRAQEPIAASGHKAVVDAAVEPTCVKTGLTEGSHCSVCDETLVEQEEVPLLEHDWGLGKIIQEPTCTEDGVVRFTCSAVYCRTTKDEAEPMLGHDLTYYEEKKPTYTENGWKAFEMCEREGCDYSTYEVILALGEPVVETYDEFIENLAILEEWTDYYVKKVSPGKDPLMLMIKYIRTGVDRYNSGSWNIMAGYEDADFANYISKREADYNANLAEGEEMLAVSGLKNIEKFYLPNGDHADIGHMFGTMDISYTNKSSEEHADVAGWAGDLVDLVSLSDEFGMDETELEKMVEEVANEYFLKDETEFPTKPTEGSFSSTDVNGDLDGFYVMQQLLSKEYVNGFLTGLLKCYFTEKLTVEDRAAYFLANRLDGVSLRSDVRDAVYNEYLTNSVVGTLEGTREFRSENLADLKKACCYAFADYICKLAGDFVEGGENVYYTVYSSESSTLAPGIRQEIKMAETADNREMKFYLATADLSNEYVHVYANYKDNDPSKGWGMSRVYDQMAAAQAKYGDPESELYEDNYTVVAGINGCGFDMSTGKPSGVLVMRGEEYSPVDSSGFFGILDDGTAMIGTKDEYNALKGHVVEAIATFGTLIEDGEVVAKYKDGHTADRASRTAIGITQTGKVVFMVLDGRQGEYSCGGSMQEIAQIMLEAGCVNAVNLDGGGSSTYVARQEGEETFGLVSSPSDGVQRSVSTSLMMVSTAPSSTAFDHAVIDSEYSYLTVGSSTKLTASAVSATGNKVDVPEGVVWAVSDETIGTLTEDGVFTAKKNGEVNINLVLDGVIVGTKTLYVVIPDNVFFTKENIRAVHNNEVTLPVSAVYEGKVVVINENDVILSLGNEKAGEIDGFGFTASEDSGLRQVKITAALAADTSVTSSIEVMIFSEDEASFDFDNATGGDRQLAWEREVSNSVLEGTSTYRAIDTTEDMVTSYSFAIDMSKIEIPPQLKDLTYMLPGADLEGANAWTFLMQLAERISVLSEVKPVLYFDKNLEPDYSELTVLNEYFELKDVEFDEEANSLSLTLKWINQTRPIDAETANPLCIVSGIKLTPKEDAAWSSANQLSICNTGEIGYRIYMRASSLYTFASKPENQAIYGLYEFENPDNPSERGGYFGSVYKTLEDRYTLVNSDKDGWVIESDGYAYYVGGERYIGIQEIDGYYYDFGANGINKGQTKYTGDMTDADGNEYYCKFGVKQTGWVLLDQGGRFYDVRYYNPDTCIKEKLTEDEIPSTCIMDGQCTYTSESGAVKLLEYDDAAGHEYVMQNDGTYKCSNCGFVRIDMEDVAITLGYNASTYTGSQKMPNTTVVAPDGTILKKRGTTSHSDYHVSYSNNIEVGTAEVLFTATRYGKYVNMKEWRGNCAGTRVVTFEIRPDLPTDITKSVTGKDVTLSWSAAKAPGVTYVIYKSEGGNTWEEFAQTENTSYKFTIDDSGNYKFKIATYKIVDEKTYESLKFTAPVDVKIDSSLSSGGSGGGGGSSSGGSGGGGGSSSGGDKKQPMTASGTASLPEYVVSGAWAQTTDGKWTFSGNASAVVNTTNTTSVDQAVSSTAVYKNAWAAVYNPYANTEIGQSDFDWFYFDADGYMVTGWIQDDGLWYYLHPVSDGTQGRMYTGWQQIDGKWYYFNPVSDGTRGAMQTNMWIGEYYVGADGVWDQTKTR